MPQLVVNYREQENKLEALTLCACGNNVQTLLTTLETMKILINSMLPDKEEFSDQRFNTIMFDQLLNTSCKEFLTNVKQASNDWIKNPKKFDQATAMSEFKKIYTNFSSAGNWDKSDEEQAKIIVFTTKLKDTKLQFSKLSKAPKTPAATGTAQRGLKAWKFENVRKFKTVDNVNHVWCK